MAVGGAATHVGEVAVFVGETLNSGASRTMHMDLRTMAVGLPTVHGGGAKRVKEGATILAALPAGDVKTSVRQVFRLVLILNDLTVNGYPATPSVLTEN